MKHTKTKEDILIEIVEHLTGNVDEYFNEWTQSHNLNSCDKCHEWDQSDNLVWISSEDFEPKAGEVLPDDVYKIYDALCEWCYQEELK